MTLLLALSPAWGLDVCVPEAFQHWNCAQTAADLPAAYALIDDIAGPHTVHLRWDVDESSVLDLDSNDDIAIIGHAGPVQRSSPTRPGYPRLAGIRTDNATLEVREVEFSIPNNTYGLEMVNDSNVTLRAAWFIAEQPTTTTNRQMVFASGGSELTVYNSHWTQITSDQGGPHLRLNNTSSAVVRNSSFENGRGTQGGSVHVTSSASLDLYDSTFDANTATEDGGGAAYVTGTLFGQGNTFDSNSSIDSDDNRGGGALRTNDDDADVTFVDTLFCSNTSSSDGGALLNRRNGDLDVERSIFWNNSTNSRGAVFYATSDASGGGNPLFARVSAAANDSQSGDDDGWFIRNAHDNNENEYDHVSLDQCIVEVANDSQWGIDRGWSVTDSMFSANDIRISPDGSQSGNDFSVTPSYAGNTCSRDAFTPTCYASSIEATETRGAVLRCASADTDADGLMDHEEAARGTQIDVADTDSDGIPDSIECAQGLTAPLTNPSFELPATSFAVTNFSDHGDDTIPGWFSTTGQIRYANALAYALLPVTTIGTQSLVLQQNNTVSQLVEVERYEDLVFRARVSNAELNFSRNFSVLFAPEGTPSPSATSFTLTGGETRWIELPIAAVAEDDVYQLQLSTSADSLYVDQVYIGPDPDTDDDGDLDCLDDDSDDDGVLDSVEYGFSDPLLADTDGDGFDDLLDPDPLVADADDDGLEDWLELILGTDPSSTDSDGDGVPDGVECSGGLVVNGSYEYRYGAPLQALYGAEYPIAEIPGWDASPANAMWIGAAGTGLWPESAAGQYVGLLLGGGGNVHEQTFTPPAGDLVWTFAHRGRWDTSDVQLQITDETATLHDQTYTGDDTSWSTRSGTVTSDGTPLTLTFTGSVSQSYLDAVAVYPASMLSTNDIPFCADATEQPLADADGDGATEDVDCDDDDPNAYPGNPEICDGIDNDCLNGIDDGVQTTYYLDGDLDGFGDRNATAQACSAPAGHVDNDEDCDDAMAEVNPDATEICNGIDDDCDAQVDEDLASQTWYGDGDGDGYGDINAPQVSCDTVAPAGTTADSTDCDDADPHIFPNATELCNDLDDDCDEAVDENLPGNTYYLDDDGDGWGGAETLTDCSSNVPPHYVTDATIGDCDDADPHIFPNATELCNDLDDDCDSSIDEGLPSNLYYVDHDNDGYGDPGVTVSDCSPSPPAGATNNDQDCDDADAAINPAAMEQCDGIDQNCDGTVDNGLPTTPYYIDGDEDGFGAGAPVARCEDEPPTGFAVNDTDCDDQLADVNPDADELCDPIDHNCDGNTQIGAVNADTWYLDSDGDGFGLTAVSQVTCMQPAGYVLQPDDCNDGNEDVNPDADEICNDVDDDCDNEIDEDAIDFVTFYVDVDRDSYGSDIDSVQACDRPDGYSVNADDCNDALPTVYLGAPELCDNIDNDCDIEVDENVIDIDFYDDLDGDGYGEATGVPTVACSAPPGMVANNSDCDDAQAAINPNVVETCDGVDSNCSGDEDDAVDPNLYFTDADDDTWGDASSPVFACEQPADAVPQNGDCNDANPANFPGNTEICDQQDNNCNGIADSDSPTAPVWRQDGDGDGYGTAITVTSCEQPSGFGVALPGDCDDGNSTVYPGAPELCDGIDNDCDGLGDLDDPDAPALETYYADTDGDGFGAGDGVLDCAVPDGFVTDATDCDDTLDAVYPGAPELCTGIDNDCDGTIENEVGYPDTDGDGYGDAGADAVCNDEDAVASHDDCNDGDPDINPGWTETEAQCGNGIDEDCDGEDLPCGSVEASDAGCKCDSGGSPSMLLGMLALLVGLRRRREAA